MLFFLILMLLALAGVYVYLTKTHRPAPPRSRPRPTSAAKPFVPSRRQPDTDDFAITKLPDDPPTVGALLFIDYYVPDREYVSWIAVLPGKPPEDYFPAGMGHDVNAWLHNAYWIRVVVVYDQAQSESLTNGHFDQAIRVLEAAGWRIAARHHDQPQRRYYRLER
jgi:hypothetical protein